jgi:hypothetical protein
MRGKNDIQQLPYILLTLRHLLCFPKSIHLGKLSELLKKKYRLYAFISTIDLIEV